MLMDLDLQQVMTVVDQTLGALGQTEAVHGGEEREEKALALLWSDFTMGEEGEGLVGDDGGTGRRRRWWWRGGNADSIMVAARRGRCCRRDMVDRWSVG